MFACDVHFARRLDLRIYVPAFANGILPPDNPLYFAQVSASASESHRSQSSFTILAKAEAQLLCLANGKNMTNPYSANVTVEALVDLNGKRRFR